MKLRVGIFFGGPSRERESSFTGGRTVYDNLNQSLFEPVPIFVDSYRHFIVLDWRNLHQHAIREFYPPAGYRPASENDFPIYIESLGRLPADEQDLLVRKIGRAIPIERLSAEIDLAFIAMPSQLDEDQLLPSLLEAQDIPYTGSGPEATQTCLDEALEKKWMAENGYNTPAGAVIQREDWKEETADSYYEAAVEQLGFPLTIRPAHYSAGIGHTILSENAGPEAFLRAIDQAFFRQKLAFDEWEGYSHGQKLAFIQAQTDLQTGLGFPIDIHFQGKTSTVSHPERLLAYLDQAEGEPGDVFVLESQLSESKVIVEKTVQGQAFSCLVLRKEDGTVVSLLPMSADGDGPLETTPEKLHEIRQDCERLFEELALQVYAQIDGVLTGEGEISWRNIDTMPDMQPGAHLYRQAATLGLTPSQLLSYLIQVSLQERSKAETRSTTSADLLDRLEDHFDQLRIKDRSKKQVAVVLGGRTDAEVQESLDSARNVYEKLASSEKYAPFPVFLQPTETDLKLVRFSPSLLLLKDGETLRAQIEDHRPQPELEDIQLRCAEIIGKYGRESLEPRPREIGLMPMKEQASAFFIALHGSFGASGELQKKLERFNIPYTGLDAQSSTTLSDRFRTLDTLKKNGIKTPELLLVKKLTYELDATDVFNRIESRFSYPLIAKSTAAEKDPAAKTIQDRTQLEAYARLLFRPAGQVGQEARRVLGMTETAEMPRSETLYIESPTPLPAPKQSVPIRAALFTVFTPDNEIAYNIFDPTEVIPNGPTNRTPARLGSTHHEYTQIIRRVKKVLEKAARILNVQGCAVIEAIVRVRGEEDVETMITNLQPFPSLAVGQDLFQQAALSNYQPMHLFDQMITFAMRRQALELGLPTTATEPPVALAPTAKAPQPEPEPKPAKAPKEEIVESPPPKQPAYQPPLSYATLPPPEENTGLWAAVKARAATFFKELGRFMKSPIFIRNISGLILLLIVLYWLLQVWLRFYTHHQQTLQVDDYTGMRIEDAIRKAERNSFAVVLMDSFFMVDRPAGIVIEQEPKPFDRVKENRTIYLIVTKRTPDEVTLPSLVGNYDYYQYARKLQRLNVRTKIREKQFSSKLEENTILHLYVDGQKITEADLNSGIKVPMGNVVEFVITERNTGMVAIPSLVCKQYDAAVFLITSMNLNLGRVVGDVPDRESAYVYRQEPPYDPDANIPMGTTINIYLTSARPSGCEE